MDFQCNKICNNTYLQKCIQKHALSEEKKENNIILTKCEMIIYRCHLVERTINI